MELRIDARKLHSPTECGNFEKGALEMRAGQEDFN